MSNKPRKPRLGRKTHTKSRRGCSNCKRRRIKVARAPPFHICKVPASLIPGFQCSETLPACGYCVKKGMRCEYPQTPKIVHEV